MTSTTPKLLKAIKLFYEQKSSQSEQVLFHLVASKLNTQNKLDTRIFFVSISSLYLCTLSQFSRTLKISRFYL